MNITEKIPIYKPWFSDMEKAYVDDALASTWISSKGPYIEKFEREFSLLFGYKYAVAVNNGTSACHLALLANDVGVGDEVIVPAATFIATANAVKYTGATPVFVDIDEDTWNIDCDLVEKAISPKTKAIFCVHLYGNPCNMDRLGEICRKNNIILVEDACEAIGAKYPVDNWPVLERPYVGRFGTAASFSCYSNKSLCTGEGGLVVTDDERIYNKVQLYKGQGQTEIYQHSVVGYNYRMTNLQAAIGLAQLRRFGDIFSAKKRVYYRYLKNFEGWSLDCTQTIEKENVTPSYWMFVLKLKTNNELLRVRLALTNSGVEWRPVFYPLYQMKPYRDCKKFLNYDAQIFEDGDSWSECLANTAVVLPSYPQLEDSQIDYICDIIKKVV